MSVRSQAFTIGMSPATGTRFGVLAAIGTSHLLNDMLQSLILAIYPLLKHGFGLGFGQLGLLTLCYQFTASLLQPLVGLLTDRRPLPYSLPLGMGFTLAGLWLLAHAPGYSWLLVAAALVGTGSSVFHPEASRVARLASGGRHGLAQSLFQVGGNLGTSLGPLLAAWIIVPHGRGSVAWFAWAALLAIMILLRVGRWYHRHPRAPRKRPAQTRGRPRSRRRALAVLLVLLVLVFSKYFYLASINSYLIFYLMQRFALPVCVAQIHLFGFLAAVAAGSLIGGPLGDRIGRKRVILFSILGVVPFTVLLPWVNLAATGVLLVLIGLVLSSAFSAILVYAQELLPHRIGAVSGLFFGFAFGMGGIGAALLGQLADLHGIVFVYRACAFLPMLGVLAVFLPEGTMAAGSAETGTRSE